MRSRYARLTGIVVGSVASVLLTRLVAVRIGAPSLQFVWSGLPWPLAFLLLSIPPMAGGILVSKWLGQRPLLHGSLMGLGSYLLSMGMGWDCRIRMVVRDSHGQRPPTSTELLATYVGYLPEMLLPLIAGFSFGLWLRARLASRSERSDDT